MGFVTNYFTLGKNGGLPKIAPNRARQLVNNFEQKKQGQPSVIIKRKEWEKLCESRSFVRGENLDIPQGNYDVYAIVFCYGIWDYSGDFYFRIRRIYKPANKPRYRGKLYIDDKNIAFADPVSVDNNEFRIKFISENNQPDEFKNINLFIEKFKQSIKEDSNFRATLPLVENSNNDCPIIQEGNIFGKKRILDELLNDKYSLLKRQAKGKPPVDFVRVNFALNIATNNLLFVFNINDDYGTEIKCPVPYTACQNS